MAASPIPSQTTFRRIGELEHSIFAIVDTVFRDRPRSSGTTTKPMARSVSAGMMIHKANTAARESFAGRLAGEF